MNTHENVNETRREIFCGKSRNLENILPTQDGLYFHVMRAELQVGIWAKGCIPNPELSTPSSWGWENIFGEQLPKWMLLPEAAQACVELIK